MFRFFLTRLLTFVPTFVGVTLISFAFIRVLPGDPIIVMAGERGMSEARYQELREQFGFDQPVLVQFWDYLTGILHGDLGMSYVTKKPVWDEFFALFPATVELSLCAIVLAICLGLPAGVIAAVNRGKFFDRALMSTALVGYSMPIFWWALLLIIVFSGTLGWTPVS
ncbi:ABC transporter permease, partial [Rhodovulum sulfidophilum]|nr:ABC transporter permease [Rhodovulum sulfidophilum]